jgi:hypothetical protein
MQLLGDSADMLRQVIYLMGTSFILGSLVTLWLLVVLDHMRHARTKRDSNIPEE